MSRGIDISNHQGSVDFDQFKDLYSFAFFKLTEGLGYRDPYFTRNWGEAKRVGMKRGAYHFARPEYGNDPQSEAGYFLGNLPPLEAEDKLILDYESASWDGDAVGWSKDFLDRILVITGKRAYFYTYYYLLKRYNWQPVIDAGYPLWLAIYDNNPDLVITTQWPSLSIKQYTSSGSVPGIVGRVDLNTSFEEDDMNQDQFNRWFDERIKEHGLDQDTVDKLIKPLLNQHIHGNDPILKQTTPPFLPPVEGAALSGSSADRHQVFWTYPDGTLHTFIDGKEAIS